MKKIFNDFEILKLEKDPETPGLFLKARKPKNYTKLTELSEISLYSVVLGKRTKELISNFPFCRKCKIVLNNLLISAKRKLSEILQIK